MASLHGTVMLRPARVGLLAAAPTLDNVRSAVQAATSAWGGRYFPISDVKRSGGDTRWFEQLSVDVLWSLSEDDAATALAQQAGFGWRGRSPYGPFDPPQQGLWTRLLEPHHLAVAATTRRVLATWFADDPLAALFAVWLGDFAADDYGEASRARFATLASAVVIPNGAEIDSDLVRLLSPIAATAEGIDYTGEGPGPGFVMVDPTIPADLLRFWNIRAAGGNVVPWVAGAENRFEGLVRDWLGVLLEADEVHRWSHGDGTPGSLYLSVWSADREQMPAALQSVVGEHDIEVLPGHGGRGGWRDMHPLSTSFRRTFTVDVDARAASVELPMPSLPWAEGLSPSLWPGVVAAEVEVSTESGLDPERTTALPRVRRLANLLDARAANSHDSFHRPNGHGGIYSVSAGEESIVMPLAHPIAVFEGLFNQDDWSFEQSDDGRFASRLDHRLGGTNFMLANQPAAREILLRAAKRGDLGSEFDTLRSLAVTARDGWPNGILDRRTPEEYARSLILQLAERKLLRSVLPMTCPSCRSVFAVEPGGLADELTCGFCEHRFPLALVLAWLGPKTKWRYRIAGHVTEARLQAALPVIATTSVLAKLARGGFDTSIDAKGLKIRRGRKEMAEFDIATVVDPFRPVVVLGEVKSHGEIDAGDLANLSLAQRTLRDKGVECFVLVATLKKAFSGVEVELLRGYCEQAAELLTSDYTEAPLALPLTFTRDQLSAHWLSDDHPWRWGEHWRGLSSTARESCIKNLGLVRIDPAGQLAERSYMFQWAQEVATD